MERLGDEWLPHLLVFMVVVVVASVSIVARTIYNNKQASKAIDRLCGVGGNGGQTDSRLLRRTHARPNAGPRCVRRSKRIQEKEPLYEMVCRFDFARRSKRPTSETTGPTSSASGRRRGIGSRRSASTSSTTRRR